MFCLVVVIVFMSIPRYLHVHCQLSISLSIKVKTQMFLQKLNEISTCPIHWKNPWPTSPNPQQALTEHLKAFLPLLESASPYDLSEE